MVRSRLSSLRRIRTVIYELLVRDWDAERDFDAVTERLDHLEWLGITAIELMPVSEFDGNTSWGYNPGPRFAVDKRMGRRNHSSGSSTRRTIAGLRSFWMWCPTTASVWIPCSGCTRTRTEARQRATRGTMRTRSIPSGWALISTTAIRGRVNSGSGCWISGLRSSMSTATGLTCPRA